MNRIEMPGTIASDSEGVVRRSSVDAEKLTSVGTNLGLLLLCLVAAFVSFWDINLYFDASKLLSIGFVTILIYIITVTVYRTKYDDGLLQGRATDGYKEAIGRFDELCKTINENLLIDSLRVWCNEYRRKEVESIRRDIITPYISYAEYESKYLMLSDKAINKLPLQKGLKRAIRSANHILPAELTADMLLNRAFSVKIFGKRKMLPKSGDEQRNIDLLLNYIKVFVRTFLCGVFVVQVASDPSIETILQWIVRMIPIVMAFITAHPAGYKNASEISVRRINAQCSVIDIFLADERKVKNEAEETVAFDKTRNGADHCSS